MPTIRYAVTMSEGSSAAVGIAELKAKLSDFVNRVIYRGEVIWITKNGKRVAALVPVEVAELAERSISTRSASRGE